MFERLIGDDSVLPVIFISAYADIPISVRVMKSGALDILVKPVRGEQLLEAIDHARKVALRRYAARTEVRDLLERYRTLTDRERAVFAGVAEGKLNKQVAVEVGACERTIKSERAKDDEEAAAHTPGGRGARGRDGGAEAVVRRRSYN